MLHVESCRYAEDYKLALQFDNGTEGIVDLQYLSIPLLLNRMQLMGKNTQHRMLIRPTI